MADDRRLTVMIIPDGDPETRSFAIPYGRLKLLVGALTLLLVLFIVMAASWWYVAAQAARVPSLERQVRQLEAERAKVAELARMLSEVEQQYERVRQMLGADGGGAAEGDAKLPPLRDSPRASESSVGNEDTAEPDGWPLTQAGYITQELAAGSREPHPGIDIAVPTDSYIRAAGGGRVREAGTSDVYGRYVLIEHGGGYRTLYGHASQLFVSPGDSVERHEVIGLTGSTGRSTAPHLHFEVHKDGRAVDPLTVLARR